MNWTPSSAEEFIIAAFNANSQFARREVELRGTRVVLQHHPEVFPCMPVSLAIAERLPLLNGLRVADVGTGTGVLALAAAIAGAREVVATDSNGEATRVARENFALNGYANRCSAALADLFPADAGQFDVIVSNPPWMRVPSELHLGIPKNMLLAVDGGFDGLREMRRLLALAPRFLRDNGKVIVPFPLWNDLNDGIEEMRNKGWQVTLLDEFELPDWLPLVFGRSSARDVGYRTVRVRIVTVSFELR